MKVRLPSDGWGLRVVDLRLPIIRDLREITLSSMHPKDKVAEFVKMLIPSSTNYSKVSYWDMQYLYNIAAYSLHFNSVEVKAQCPKCKASVKHLITLADQHLHLLTQPGKYTAKVCGKSLHMRLLSMQDVLYACEFAVSSDDYDTAYWDALVTLSLFFEHPTKEFYVLMDKTHELLQPQYMAPILYLQACYHGMETSAKVKCSHCSNEFNLFVMADASFIDFDVNDLMDTYSKLSSMISFSDLLNLSFAELKAFIKGVNESRRSGK